MPERALLDLVGLTPLMQMTSGRPDMVIAVIDGPVAADHPSLASSSIRLIGSTDGSACAANAVACQHGTSVASVLVAPRNSSAPGVCPACTLAVCPILSDSDSREPYATPAEMSDAIAVSVDAGCRLINLSVGLAQPSTRGEPRLEAALDYAARHGVVTVAAGGNQSAIASTPITRHPSVIPVAACDPGGRPLRQSNLARSIGLRGIMAPGRTAVSTTAALPPLAVGGTSTAAAVVTGALALLWSLFPTATAADIRFALTQSHRRRRAALLPPLLHAWAAYRVMATMAARRRTLKQ